MRDNYGDLIEIERVGDCADITFSVGEDVATMELNSKRLRKMARKLNEVASTIEIRHRENSPRG